MGRGAPTHQVIMVGAHSSSAVMGTQCISENRTARCVMTGSASTSPPPNACGESRSKIEGGGTHALNGPF